MTTHTPSHPRGSVYVLVLLTALLVTVLGLAAVSVQAAVRQRSADSADGARAASLARSALELAVECIRAEGDDWRKKLDSGAWLTDAPLGATPDSPRLSVTASDPKDGKIKTGKNDPLDLTATVAVGDAVRSVTVRLEQQELPIRALAASVSAHDVISVTGNATLSMSSFTGQTPIVAARGTATANGGTITAEAESPSGFTGAGFAGGTRWTAWAREVPEWDDVYDEYEDDAEDIAASDLPNLLGLTYYIDEQAIGPDRNPFGSKKKQPEGIYRIDMSGKALVISNSRIVGTLVIRNALSVTVMGSVSWEPAVPGYPALLVEGPIFLSHQSSELSESGRNTNFNPSGVPYNGVTDSDKSDTYPSLVAGLVYASGRITGGSANALVRGPVLTRDDLRVGLFGGLRVEHDDTTWNNPPPGFRREFFAPLRGSYARVVD